MYEIKKESTYSQHFLICLIVNYLLESTTSSDSSYVIFVHWSLYLRSWYRLLYSLVVLCRSVTSLSSWSSCLFWSVLSWFLHTNFLRHYCMSHVVHFIFRNWSTSLYSISVHWINNCRRDLYGNIFHYSILLIRLSLLDIL